MNDIKLFEFEHENLECIVLDEEPLFNPFSVGKCLDLKESSVKQYLSEMGNDERFDLKYKDENTTINLKFINDHPRFLLRLMRIGIMYCPKCGEMSLSERQGFTLYFHCDECGFDFRVQNVEDL